MKILITGASGFVGYSLLETWRDRMAGSGNDLELFAIDNLSRRGSELNLAHLERLGANFYHGDLRNQSDLDHLPAVDWVVDASANPSVLAGVDGTTSSRQIIEHNLQSTVNMLEYCRRHSAGFVLLSTSRVYSIVQLCQLPLLELGDRYQLDARLPWPPGVSEAGVTKEFSTEAPISLYGSTKLASEVLALEYGSTFGIPVWIDRCGVLAGAGQFGRPDQGIVAFWIHSWHQRRPLKYIGFNGNGFQVRDCLHPADLAELVWKQMGRTESGIDAEERLFNVGGGAARSFSLRALSDWCQANLGPHSVGAVAVKRRFDIPWLVMDSARTEKVWGWQPSRSLESIFSEIAEHALQNPNWLEVSLR